MLELGHDLGELGAEEVRRARGLAGGLGEGADEGDEVLEDLRERGGVEGGELDLELRASEAGQGLLRAVEEGRPGVGGAVLGEGPEEGLAAVLDLAADEGERANHAGGRVVLVSAEEAGTGEGLLDLVPAGALLGGEAPP